MKKINVQVYELGGGKSENQDNNNLYIDGIVENGKIKTIEKIEDKDSVLLEQPDVDENLIEFLEKYPEIKSDGNDIWVEVVISDDYGILAEFTTDGIDEEIYCGYFDVDPHSESMNYISNYTAIIPSGTIIYNVVGYEETYTVTLTSDILVDDPGMGVSIPKSKYTYVVN